MKVRDEAVPARGAEATASRATASPATIEYVHLPLNEDVIAFAGYYTPENEVRRAFRDREVLYVTGHVVVEATCHDGSCATANYWYAIVPGYVVDWQYRENESGLPVTLAEPISDPETRREIEAIILDSEAVGRVDFR